MKAMSVIVVIAIHELVALAIVLQSLMVINFDRIKLDQLKVFNVRSIIIFKGIIAFAIIIIIIG